MSRKRPARDHLRSGQPSAGLQVQQQVRVAQQAQATFGPFNFRSGSALTTSAARRKPSRGQMPFLSSGRLELRVLDRTARRQQRHTLADKQRIQGGLKPFVQLPLIPTKRSGVLQKLHKSVRKGPEQAPFITRRHRLGATQSSRILQDTQRRVVEGRVQRQSRTALPVVSAPERRTPRRRFRQASRRPSPAPVPSP